MKTNLMALGIGVVAVAALGVFGMERMNREGRPEPPRTQVVSNPTPTPGRTTYHYQVDPTGPSVPAIPAPALPTAQEPPLRSTGELEKKLKDSLDKLQKALPTLANTEESGLSEPGQSPPPKSSNPLPSALTPKAENKKPEADRPAPPLPPAPTIPTSDNKSESPLPILSAPPLPPVSAQDKAPDLPAPPPTSAGKTPNVPAKAPPPLRPSASKVDEPDASLPPLPSAGGSAPPVPPAGISAAPAPLDGFRIPAPKTDNDAPKKVDAPIVAPAIPRNAVDVSPVRNTSAAVPSQDDFQKRLIELELKYLQGTSDELTRRIQQLPDGDADRRRLTAEQQRILDRIRRLMRAAELAAVQRTDDSSGKSLLSDSPWTMHLETADGKTVLQAVVHRKARFKIVCDRLDLQSPRGTVLAAGHVQISGEGFQGNCDRLSIPLHEDRLILEGGAEVGIRTQSMSIVESSKDGPLPTVESRRLDDQTSPVPILHLKGDHLDLRWSDLQPGPASSARANERPLSAKELRATPGPMVKVAFNSAANEKWSEWGTLRRVKQTQDGHPEYLIADAAGLPIAYVHTPAGLSLAEYVGKRVSVFGRASRAEERLGQEIRGDGRPVLTFTASHVAWE